LIFLLTHDRASALSVKLQGEETPDMVKE
jgi:hypothetical protein